MSRDLLIALVVTACAPRHAPAPAVPGPAVCHATALDVAPALHDAEGPCDPCDASAALRIHAVAENPCDEPVVVMRNNGCFVGTWHATPVAGGARVLLSRPCTSALTDFTVPPGTHTMGAVHVPAGHLSPGRWELTAPRVGAGPTTVTLE